jgi:tetratricopeptide (TPR) repeat protein
VPVRVRVADDPDPLGAALVRNEGILRAPRLLAVSSDGEVVLRDFGPLTPRMTPRAEVVPGGEAVLPTIDRVLETLERAAALDRADREVLAVPEEGLAAPDRAARADVLERRGRRAEAVAAWRGAVALDPVVAWRERLAALLAREGRRDEARAEYERLADDHPDDPRRRRWRVRGVLVGHGLEGADPPRAGTHPDEALGALEALAEDARSAGDVEAEGLARLGAAYAWLGAEEHPSLRSAVRWMTKRIDAVPWSPETMMATARLAGATGLPDDGASWLETLLRRHAESSEADQARHGLVEALAERARAD